MKILVSAHSCDPARGGEPAIGWNWAFELSRAGHDVWVLTSPEGKTSITAFLEKNPVPRLRVVFVDNPYVPRFFGPFFDHFECIWWQKRALERARELDAEVNFDVVHHVSWASLHVGSQLWRLGKPFVFGPVGGGQTAPMRFRRYLRGGWVAELLRSIVVRYFTRFLFSASSTVSNASVVLVTNEETREWVERLGARRVEFMLDVGIAESLIAQRRPAKRRKRGDELKILWVGKLDARKGLLLALEALSKIDPSVRYGCTILGDGQQGRYVRQWIAQLGLGDRVAWRGQVPWPDVLDAYQSHDVLLFSSLRDTSGAQLLEAMAKGAAIVTLDHQGARVVVPDDAGLKVPVTTPEETSDALARALERVANEPELLAAMGRNGMKFAAEQTWRRKAARALSLYPVRRAAKRKTRREMVSARS